MRVLLDYHHHDLWESMELLCERLGWNLYRPIGMEWFDQGYWNHERKWHGDAVARQYLEPWGSDFYVNDVPVTRTDRSHGREIRLRTLEQARILKPDIVISSLAHNHEGFARFASEVGATFGLQVGNVRFGEQDMAEDRWDLAAFGLVSGFMPGPIPKPHVVYHQEFSLEDFRYEPPFRDYPIDERGLQFVPNFTVASFVQCYPQDLPAYGYWLDTAPKVPELDWRVYGAYGEAAPDRYEAGNLDRCADVGSQMRAADVGWHAKRWSDGYGHVIHNWFAVGRPVFGFEDYYRTQMAGPLWQDGITSFDIGSRSPDEVAGLLRMLRDNPDKHLRMCEAAAARFREIVNFDEEEQAIRRMFEEVLP